MKKGRLKRGLMIFLVFVLLILGTGLYVFIDDNTVALTDYTIYSTKLPGSFVGYKILLISDFHNSYYYDQVIAKAVQASPDIIVLAGDMIQVKQNTYENTEVLMQKLVEIAPVYMVQGNHETWYKDNKGLKANITELGVTLLNTKQVAIEKNGAKINLYGMTDPALTDTNLPGSSNLTNIMKKAKEAWDPKTFSMLLMHRANLFEFMNDFEYDLVMAGHIHGGLIRLPFIGGLVSSDNVWFPRYTKGIYTKKGSKMVVSRGADYDLHKPRIFNGPEVVLITLEK